MSVCVKLKFVQKGRNAKRGVGVLGAKKFKVGPKRENCKKGGWCTGCEKNQSSKLVGNTNTIMTALYNMYIRVVFKKSCLFAS